MYFTSAEDLILKKLLWYKQSQSTRQLEDTKSILEFVADKLDFDYLKKWSKILNNVKLLKQVMSSL